MTEHTPHREIYTRHYRTRLECERAASNWDVKALADHGARCRPEMPGSYKTLRLIARIEADAERIAELEGDAAVLGDVVGPG